MEWCYEIFLDKLNEISDLLVKSREDDFHGKSVDIEPEYGLSFQNVRSLSAASGDSTNRKVTLNQLTNQVLWYVCWYAYHVWCGTDVQVDKIDFLHRLHVIDNHDDSFQFLSCKNLVSWNSEELIWIYAYATNFILFHEIAHIVKGHTLMNEKYEVRPYEELKGYEIDADKYSMESIMDVAQSRNQREFGFIGIICAQCLLFFDRKKVVDYSKDPHGDPMDRIEQKLQMVGGNTDGYRLLVSKLKRQADLFIAEKYGTEG